MESPGDEAGDAVGQQIAVVSDALPDWSLDEVLAALTTLGVAGIESRIGDSAHLPVGDRRGAVAAAARITEAGMTLCGVDATAECPLGHPDLTRVADLACTLRAGFLRIFPPAYEPERSVGWQIDEAADALRALRRHSDDGLELLLEPCQGSIAPSAELAVRILQASGTTGSGVVFDPANMLVEGHLRPEMAIDLLGDRLRHVHVKNFVLTRGAGAWQAAPSDLEDGDVDWRATLGCLARAGYDGWLSIDHLSGAATARQLELDVTALRRLRGAAGDRPGMPLDPSGDAAALPIPPAIPS